jgi:hypothetical protein
MSLPFGQVSVMKQQELGWWKQQAEVFCNLPMLSGPNKTVDLSSKSWVHSRGELELLTSAPPQVRKLGEEE